MRTWPGGDRWAWLTHPLVGRHRLVSAVGIGYCAATVAATLLAAALYAGLVDLVPGWTVRLVDGYSAVLIIGAVLSATVVPTVYAVANRGPALAAATGVVPYLTVAIMTLEHTLTNDLVVALVGASLGATVAVALRWYDVVDGDGQRRPTLVDLDGALVASGLSLVALVAVWRFASSAPAGAVATIDPLPWLVVLPVIGSLSCLVLAALHTE